MSAGKEIKRLVINARITASKAAKEIGVDADRLRKWMERDADPKDTGDIQAVEAFFGCSLADLSKVDKFQTKSKASKEGLKNDPTDVTAKYIALLEEKANVLSSRDLLERLEEIQAGQLTIRHFLGRLLAKVERTDLKKIEQEMNKFLSVSLKEIDGIGS